MVRCPICGEEVSLDDYLDHFDEHDVDSQGPIRISKPRDPDEFYLNMWIEPMTQEIKDRDLDALLVNAMDALHEVGNYYGLKGQSSVYGSYLVEYSAIARMVSKAVKRDWFGAQKELDRISHHLSV